MVAIKLPVLSISNKLLLSERGSSNVKVQIAQLPILGTGNLFTLSGKEITGNTTDRQAIRYDHNMGSFIVRYGAPQKKCSSRYVADVIVHQ